MELVQLYYVAELVGVVAVVGSLLFVGAQLREQIRTSRLAAIHEFSVEFRNLSTHLLQDAEFASIYVEMMNNGLSSLPTDKAIRGAAFLQNTFRLWEDMYYQHSRQRLDDRLLLSMEEVVAAQASSKAFAEYWAARKSWFSDEFVYYADNKMLDMTLSDEGFAWSGGAFDQTPPRG